MEEGVYITESGECLKGITVFNVPIGEPDYVEAVLCKKAMEITEEARAYVENLEDEYP